MSSVITVYMFICNIWRAYVIYSWRIKLKTILRSSRLIGFYILSKLYLREDKIPPPPPAYFLSRIVLHFLAQVMTYIPFGISQTRPPPPAMPILSWPNRPSHHLLNYFEYQYVANLFHPGTTEDNEVNFKDPRLIGSTTIVEADVRNMSVLIARGTSLIILVLPVVTAYISIDEYEPWPPHPHQHPHSHPHVLSRITYRCPRIRSWEIGVRIPV